MWDARHGTLCTTCTDEIVASDLHAAASKLSGSAVTSLLPLTVERLAEVRFALGRSPRPDPRENVLAAAQFRVLERQLVG